MKQQQAIEEFGSLVVYRLMNSKLELTSPTTFHDMQDNPWVFTAYTETDEGKRIVMRVTVKPEDYRRAPDCDLLDWYDLKENADFEQE